MAARGKLILLVFVALLVCLSFGYVWGASGRLTIQAALDSTRQQLDIAEARGHLLDARVALYNINFGEATRHLEDAKTALYRVRKRYQELGRGEAAVSIDAALKQIEEGQRLAGKLDQSANTKAGDALESIKAATSR